MKKYIAFASLVLVAIVLTGCPAQNGSQLQQAAQASENAAIIMQGFENAEIAAYQQGLIPAADHQFIQKEVATVAALGKTTDSCIAGTATPLAAVPVELRDADGALLFLRRAQLHEKPPEFLTWPDSTNSTERRE